MPKCSECPVREFCAVAGTERAAALPTRAAPKPRRVEQRTVYVAVTNEKAPRVLLHKRPAKGLLSGLWELPNITESETLPLLSQLSVSERFSLGEGVHVFSHVEWRMTGECLKVAPFEPPEGYVLVTAEELAAMALPTAFRTYTAQLPLLLEEDVL
jgi:A/G-specific adenine glycosylase